MALFFKTHRSHSVPRPHRRKPTTIPSRLRVCRFEQMEPRELLSASATPDPIHVGVTYFEDSGEKDTSSYLKIDGVATTTKVADLFELTFAGGALGTTLNRFEIDTGTATYFDTTAEGAPCEGWFGLAILNESELAAKGITVSSSVADGGTTLVFTFSNFKAGDRLVFTLDVDEAGPTEVAEGGEFGIPNGYLGNPSDKASFSASFSAEGTFEAVASDVSFRNVYSFSTSLASALPDDDMLNDVSGEYLPWDSPAGRVYTAGAEGCVEQTPVTEISGYVYYDRNNSHAMDASEVGISGATLTLLDQNGNAVTLLDSFGKPIGATSMTTDANGYYHAYVTAGEYSIVETQPSGYLDGYDAPGYIDGSADTVSIADNPYGDRIDGVVLAAGQVGTHYDFGEIKLAELSGHVYFDSINNDHRDTGEIGLAEISITILDGDGNIVTLLDKNGEEIGGSTKTDANGYYHVYLLPSTGTYSIVEGNEYMLKTYGNGAYRDGNESIGTVRDAGSSVKNKTGTNASNDQFDEITLLGGQIGENYDFGELGPSISGKAYVDVDRNGIFDGSDVLLAGATIYLLDSAGNRTGTSMTTGTDGTYKFTNLPPGVYGVEEVFTSTLYINGSAYVGVIDDTPSGETSGKDKIVGAKLKTAQDGYDYDFTEWVTAKICGQVFVDLNNNNVIDPDTLEKAIEGVRVNLLDSTGSIVQWKLTDANGKYCFTGLDAGKYTIQEVHPSGYIDGRDYAGPTTGNTPSIDNDTIVNVTVGYGDHAYGNDFTELLPANISGYVFQDGAAIVLPQNAPDPDIPSLRDGQLTPDDKRLAGVRLTLCDAYGTPILSADNKLITTVTDSNGYYEFTNLAPGMYSIIQEQPEDYISGIDTAGSNGGVVVNQYASVDPQILSTLAVSPTGSAIVRIGVDAGDAAAQYNFSEVLVERVSGYPTPYIPPANPSPMMPPVAALPFVEYRSYGAPYVMATTVTRPLFGGSGGPGGYTWHLSIINAGQVREDGTGDRFTLFPQNTIFDPVTWTGASLDQSQWILANENGDVLRTVHFGMAGSMPVTGDWDGSGTTRVGVFIDGLWFLDMSGNERWDENDLWAKLGKKGDQAVTGDWDGDGKTDIGIFGPAWIGDVKAISVEPGLPDADNAFMGRPKNVPPEAADAAVGFRTMKNGQGGQMRSDLIDHVFEYGTKGDRAVTGDWNGDGIRSIGIFRNGVWFLDMDGNGRWSEGDVTVDFGQEGDLPIVGDWTGDGISKLGVYRNGTFYLDTNNNRQIDATDKVFALGQAGDVPVAGDWTGNGVDKVGVYRSDAGPVAQAPAATTK